MLGANSPSEFTRVERNGHVVRHGNVERLCQVVVGAPLRIHGAEIPKLVLYDRAADISAKVLFGKTICCGTRKWKIVYGAHGTAGGKVAKNIPMNFVAAALGDDVEDATGGLAVLRSIGAGLDFHFLHE